MPLLRSCCCFDLKVGTKIIGVIGLILQIINFLMTAILLMMFGIIEVGLKQALDQAIAQSKSQASSDNGDSTITGNSEAEQHVEQLEAMEPILGMAKYVLLVILALFFLDIVFTSCLIHGIRKNRRGLLPPWIFLHAIYVLVELALIIAFIVFMAKFPFLYEYVLPALFGDLVWMGIHIYLVLVVVSQFQALGLIRMQEEEMSMK